MFGMLMGSMTEILKSLDSNTRNLEAKIAWLEIGEMAGETPSPCRKRRKRKNTESKNGEI